MGPFEMVVLLVLITTIGKVLTNRRDALADKGSAPQLAPGEVDSLRDAVDDLSGRVVRLEQERDFYKELLDAPGRQRALADPGVTPNTEAGGPVGPGADPAPGPRAHDAETP